MSSCFFKRAMGFHELSQGIGAMLPARFQLPRGREALNKNYQVCRAKLLERATFTSSASESGGYWKEHCTLMGADDTAISCGWWSTPSVKELHTELETILREPKVRRALNLCPLPANDPQVNSQHHRKEQEGEGQSARGLTPKGVITLGNMSGESGALHSDPANQYATIQAASQFNYLEMPSPNVTPEHGVANYAYDQTQGPACAMACAGATVYRNYLVPRSMKTTTDEVVRGQTRGNQLNGLEDIEDILLQDTGKKYNLRFSGRSGSSSTPWRVKNGYAESSMGRLQVFNECKALFGTDDPAQAAINRYDLWSHLRIGVHEDAQVTRNDPQTQNQIVTQTFNSAVPIGYSQCSSEAWAPLAKMVLHGTYEATLLVGAINAARHASAHGVVPPILLTKVGGGVFQNDDDWIQRAITSACVSVTSRHGILPLNVQVVHFGSTMEPEYAELQGKRFGPRYQ